MLKSALKRLLALTPYRIVYDRGENRFQAIDSTLKDLAAHGYDPRVVIDGGAHLGAFSTAAQALFPRAKFHLFEPQRACQATLRALCADRGYELYPFALGDAPGEVCFEEGEAAETGAHVVPAGTPGSRRVKIETLDNVFETIIGPGDRTMLKLDLQGYELHALRGAKTLLPMVEIVLTEVSFYRQAYEPTVAELVSFLDERGYELYDIASLGPRFRDNRLQQGDFLFVKRGSALLADNRWA